MKSPHWWSNQASPVTSTVRPSIVSVPVAAIDVRE
jgi:hypothetical protein